jgi:16S rRNA (guanine(1405)-N(7))-methyltransferase
MTPEDLAEAVAESRKYRHVSRETVLRIASASRTVKAVKRKLHQISAGFISSRDVARIARLVDALRDGAPVRAVCDAVLKLHSSTAERLPYCAEFYRRIFAVTGAPASILDIGCGLNPFSVPYMDLPAPVRYVATDIDALLIECVNRFFAAVGLPSGARVEDAVCSPPSDEVDLALALKLLPSLEQQAKGSSLRLLEQVRAKRLVVSFPLTTLGGRCKGMLAHYSRQYEEMLTGSFSLMGRFTVPAELVYVLERC